MTTTPTPPFRPRPLFSKSKDAIEKMLRSKVDEFAEAIAPFYQSSNWKWCDVMPATIPTKQRIIGACNELIADLVSHEGGAASAGGIEVFYYWDSEVNLWYCGIQFQYKEKGWVSP